MYSLTLRDFPWQIYSSVCHLGRHSQAVLQSCAPRVPLGSSVSLGFTVPSPPPALECARSHLLQCTNARLALAQNCP